MWDHPSPSTNPWIWGFCCISEILLDLSIQNRSVPGLVLFGSKTPAPLEVTAKDPAVPLEAEAKDPPGSNSHCSEHFSGIAVDTRPAPPILVFIVVFIFCPSRAPHGRAFQDGSAGSAVYGAFLHGKMGFGFFGISTSLLEPWCEVTEPGSGAPWVYFPLKSS